MRKKPSLKDIAIKAGVSTALVSYVLNNQKTDRINKQTAAKIRDIAARLNYRINFIAKSLKTKKTMTIGLVVADISNPFFSSLARVIEDEAEKKNYTVIFGSSDENPKKMETLLATLLNYQVDGLIIAPTEHSENQIINLQKTKIHFVLIDRHFPALKTNYINIDNFQAAYTAVKHILQTGCKRIGIVTYSTELINLKDRKRGYEAALKEQKIKPAKQWIKELTSLAPEQEVKNAIDALIKPGVSVDAIFFTSNILSTYGLKYINSLKIKVPEELSVVSFDQSIASELFYAPVTHIQQPLKTMGELATCALLDAIDKKKKTEIVLQAELIIRKSTKPVKIVNYRAPQKNKEVIKISGSK